MRVRKSGDKSVAFFIAYMNLKAFRPVTLENFKQALQMIQKK